MQTSPSERKLNLFISHKDFRERISPYVGRVCKINFVPDLRRIKTPALGVIIKVG